MSSQEVDRDVISKMKRVDSTLAAGTKAIVPVTAGVLQPHHPAIMEDTHDIPISEKLEALPFLSQENVRIDTEITQEDIDTIKKKAYVATLRDFDRWLINDYLKGVDDQVKKAWLLDVYPEWFDRQKEAIDSLNDVKKKYELLRLEGPTTLEEIYFMYAFERDASSYEGSIAHYALNGILGASSAADVKTKLGLKDDQYDPFVQKSFERGLFNTRKRFNQMFKQWMLVYNNDTAAMATDRPPIYGPSNTEVGMLNKQQLTRLSMPYAMVRNAHESEPAISQVSDSRYKNALKGHRSSLQPIELAPTKISNAWTSPASHVPFTPQFASGYNWLK